MHECRLACDSTRCLGAACAQAFAARASGPSFSAPLLVGFGQTLPVRCTVVSLADRGGSTRTLRFADHLDALTLLSFLAKVCMKSITLETWLRLGWKWPCLEPGISCLQLVRLTDCGRLVCRTWRRTRLRQESSVPSYGFVPTRRQEPLGNATQNGAGYLRSTRHDGPGEPTTAGQLLDRRRDHHAPFFFSASSHGQCCTDAGLDANIRSVSTNAVNRCLTASQLKCYGHAAWCVT